MTDFRQTLLWMIFLSSVVFLWDGWQRHTGKPSMFFPATTSATQTNKPSPNGTPATATTATTATTPTSVPGAVALPGQANSVATSPVPVAAAPTAAPREKVIFSNDMIKATVDSQGGELVRVEFLKHIAKKGATEGVVLLTNSDPSERLYTARTGLINLKADGAFLPNHTTPMTFRPGERSMGADGKTVLTLESQEAGGVKLVKTYTLTKGSYLIDVKHEAINTGAVAVQPQLYLQLVRDGNKAEGGAPSVVQAFGVQTFTGPAVYTEAKKFEHISFEDIEKGKTSYQKQSKDGWIAMVQHYFVSAWIAPKDTPREIQTRKEGTNLYSIGTVLPMPLIAPEGKASVTSQLFVGPQEERNLEGIAPGLELVKDYGWFTIFAKPLFWLLEKIHNIFGNWGWSIIGLTFVVKMAFFPLQSAAYRSMAKMKAVTPRMTEIRERFKDKPQEMNKAMMELYRAEKVNPFGGCLPIVIQIPVFIALYWVLLSSVEMRGAPWLGWIQDLSLLDPYYILPALMTATMFLQIKLNPTPPDPLQAKLMWAMPAIFSIMFFFFPAGLVLYWLTNNVLSIAQQWYINKQMNVA